MADETRPLLGDLTQARGAVRQVMDEALRAIETVRAAEARGVRVSSGDLEAERARIRATEGRLRAAEANQPSYRRGERAGGVPIEERRAAGGEPYYVPQGAGGRGGLPPRRPPAPPSGPGGRGLGPEDEVQASRVARAYALADTEIGRSNQTLQRSTQIVDSHSQALRRHGALTSEFISAAARGEASYREWGYQIGATAGKFAGWTAVSIPVFAALDGVRKIGEGAIQSASGVNSLKRTINDVGSGDRAQEQFRALAEKFNLPIGDVVSAVSQMGQVFHTTDEAVQGATAVLYAYRTGGVDVADATKQLIAVVNGFQLSGGDLVGVFDKLNQVQNRFGATIPDTQAGLAKAAGSFRQAGGDVDHLIALLAAAQKASGRSGQEIGTAIARGIGYIRRPQSAKALRDQGLDPTKPFPQLLEQAFQKGKQPGADVQGLAQALVGNQYARILVPLIADSKRYYAILNDLPNASKRGGASQRELNNVLAQADEQLKKIGTNLEVLGSNLAQAGFGTGAAVFLKTLNLALETVNGILNTFNKLPEPLRIVTTGFIQIVALMRLMRRFNIGQALENRSPRLAGLLVENPERRARRLVGRGLRQEGEFTQDELERRSTAYARSETTRNVAERRAAQVAAEEQLAVSGALGAERQAKAESRVLAFRGEADAARNRSITLAVEEEALNQRMAEIEARNAAYRSQVLRGRTSALAFARREGLYIRPSLDRPGSATERPVIPGHEGGAPTGIGALPGGDALEHAAAERAAEHARRPAIPPNAGRLGGFRGRYAQAFENAYTGSTGQRVTQYISEAENMSRTQYRFAQMQAGMKAAAGTAGSAIGTGARALKAGTTAISGALLGPEGLFFAALIALPEVYDLIKSRADQAAKEAETLAKIPRSGGEQAQQLKTARDKLKGPNFPEGLDLFRREFTKNVVGLPGDITGVGDDVQKAIFGDQSQYESGVAAAQSVIKAAKARQEQQSVQRRKGVPVTGLYKEEIDSEVQHLDRLLRGGRLDPDQYINELRKRLTEARQAEASQADKLSAINAIKGRILQAATGKEFYSQLFLNNQNQKQLDQNAKGLASLIGGRLASPTQIEHYAATQLNLIQAAESGRNTPSGQQVLAQRSQDLVNTISSSADQELQRGLLFARSGRERDAAYQKYYQALRSPVQAGRRGQRAYSGQRQAIERSIRAVQENIGTDRDAIGLARQQGRLGDIPGLALDLGRQLGRLQSLRNRMRQNGQRSGRLNRAISEYEKRIREVEQEQRRQQFQEKDSLAASRTEVASFDIGAGLPRLRFQLRAIGQRVARAIRIFGKDSQEALNLIQQQQQIREQVVQQQEGLIEAQSNLAAARSTSPDAEANARLSGLQRKLGFQRAHPNIYSSTDITQTLADIAQARKDNAERLRQEAIDEISAYYAYLEAGTDDPYKIALYEERKAQRIYDQGGFKTNAERLQAAADLRKARADRARTGYQQRYEDIEYYADIGKYGQEQELAMLRRLEKNTRKYRDLNREIKRRIYQLTHENDQDFELNVGNVRIPTLYEIRRAVGQRQQGGVTINNRNTANVNVNSPEDVPAVARALEDNNTGMNKAAARAAGIR